MTTHDPITDDVTPPRRSTRARLTVLVMALALLAMSCSDDGSETSSPTTDTDRPSTTSTTAAPTSTSTSSTSAPQSVEEEIIARYIGYWEARFAANSGTPNPDDPALREFATGEQLEQVIDETRSNLEQGLAFQRPDNPSDFQQVTVIEIDGDTAVVQECVVSDGIIIRRDTGEVVNDDVATHNVRGELVRVEGAWRVSSTRLIQRWEGIAGCAAES